MSVTKYLSTLPRQEGKTMVVTGANSGIGLQTARHLARLGAHVILACRSREKAELAMEQIRQELPGASLEFAPYDQASFAALESFAKRLEDRRIDALVLNAGICGADCSKKTADGYPLIFGTNYHGPRYLVELWREKLSREGTRVVFVASLAGRFSRMQPIREFRGGGANRQYGYSKLCLAIFACRCMEEGLQAVLVHPGASGTNILFGQDSSLPGFVTRAGRRLLDAFPNKGERPGLMAVSAICCPYEKGLYIRPGLPLGIVGNPKRVPLPRRFYRFGMIGSSASAVAGSQ